MAEAHIPPSALTGNGARVLSEEEKQRLEKDQTLVPEFKRNKLELEAQKNWDLFYKRNTTKFFKDRHWTKREFQELVGGQGENGEKRVLFEVGCGVGNFMFPLLEEDDSQSLYIYACDFSKRAVQFVKEHVSYDESRCSAFHADITDSDTLADNVPASCVDLATMIFVLSAIHPDKMLAALTNVLWTLKAGGVLLFRDYGLYDHAMLRFSPGHKLAQHFYVRQDGTRAFYFSLEYLQAKAEEAGFVVQQIEYVYRDTVNKKEGLCVPRIFVQAKFTKPSTGVSQTWTAAEREWDTDTLQTERETASASNVQSDCSHQLRQCGQFVSDSGDERVKHWNESGEERVKHCSNGTVQHCRDSGGERVNDLNESGEATAKHGCDDGERRVKTYS